MYHQYVETEKRVMAALDGIFPFIVGMHLLATDPDNTYLIMPLTPGGNLFDLVYERGSLGEYMARFYSAQILLALEFLHATGFVHRDLKPENVLIDANGYLRLADFSMIKSIGRGRTYTFCGTPDYMAPEIFTYKGYSQAVDFWSLGAMMYELTTGRTPFEGPDVGTIFQNALNTNYNLDVGFSPSLQSLLRNMLQPDLSKRYGNLKNGVIDIKKHPWFRPVNWLQIINQKMEAPFKPDLEWISKKEIRNILDSYENEYVDF
ncbi:cAMP-dependent protein kinase catalytic subunit alpha-like [Adelges cooleyi]|uniref:cAMP-dependent protein kinase catalytic subunit alpha-like n=1 Tax=Adelges cooleyi TaxID=133065 RepID=UPI00217F641B|nr:cAMP-dependent protein kinase catalytic subunit alpha-like [Adelges cooleyi]